MRFSILQPQSAVDSTMTYARNSLEEMSPQLGLQPQDDHLITEPFPEYTEPQGTTTYGTFADRDNEERARAGVFTLVHNSQDTPAATSKAHTQAFNNWVSSLPRRSNENVEGTKEQAYEGTSCDFLHRVTFLAWGSLDLSTEYLREPCVTLEEMHTLFAQLEGGMPTVTSADPVPGSTVADISHHNLQIPPHGVGGVNLGPQEDDFQLTQSSKNGGVCLIFGEAVPLQGIRGVTDVVSNNDCPRSLPFRDSGIHMEDECAEARAIVSTHACSQPNDSLLNCHVADARSPDIESNPTHADNDDGGRSAKSTVPTSNETNPILPDLWLEEEQCGAECLEHTYYDLEGFAYPSATQQAREDMLLLFSDQAENYVWNAFPKIIARMVDGASSNEVDRVQGEDRRAEGSREDRGLLGTSRTIGPFQNLPPGHVPKLAEVSDSIPTEASDLALRKVLDQPHELENMVGLGIAGISSSKPINPGHNTETTDLDYMSLNHPNRQERDESTCADLSKEAVLVPYDKSIERAPDPASLAGTNVVRSDNTAPLKTIDNPQQLLVSPVPSPTTPANAQKIGRHPSQGLLTPSYGTVPLSLPNNTPESPCTEAAKPKRTYKKRARPNTRKQALAEAEAFDSVPDVHQSIDNTAAQPLKPPEYLLAKMAKPNNIMPQQKKPSMILGNSPLLPMKCVHPQDLIVPPFPLTPGDTTESQEFMTPDPPPSPFDFLKSAESAPALPSSANKQKVSANKRKCSKRTLSNKQSTSVEGTQGLKLGGKRTSGRLVKKREKVKG